MMHPLLAVSVANRLFNDRTAAATPTRRVRRKAHDATRPTVASDDTSGAAMVTGDVVIRRAVAADGPALARLGALDGNRAAGELLAYAADAAGTSGVLVAETDGEIAAALALDGGLAVADPFRASAAHARLLALRAEQLGADLPRSDRGHVRMLAPRTS